MDKRIKLVLTIVFLVLFVQVNINSTRTLAIDMTGEKVVIFIADGTSRDDFEDVITPLEGWGVDITVAGLVNEHLNDHSETMVSDVLISNLNMTDYDCIYIPGGDGAFVLANSAVVISKVTSAYDEGLTMGAFCAGPVVLARANLVDGIHISCFPTARDEVETAGGILENDEEVFIDGRFVSGQWPNMYSFSFSLAKAMGYSYVENISVKKLSGSNVLITVQTDNDDIFITSVNVSIYHKTNTTSFTLIENIELLDEDNDGNFTIEYKLIEYEGTYSFDIIVEDFFDNQDIILEATTFIPERDDSSISGFYAELLFSSLVLIAVFSKKKKNFNH